MSTVTLGTSTLLDHSSGADFVIYSRPAGANAAVTWEINTTNFSSSGAASDHWGVITDANGTGDPAFSRRGEPLWQDAQGIAVRRDGRISWEYWYRTADSVGNASGATLLDAHVLANLYQVTLVSLVDGTRYANIRARYTGKWWTTLRDVRLPDVIQPYSTLRSGGFCFLNGVTSQVTVRPTAAEVF